MPISDEAKNFDFNSWFGGAGLPEESADVYTKGNLVGRINYLTRRIEEAQRVAAAGADEASVGEETGTEELEAELTALLEEFAASRVTVYLRALELPERRKIRKQHEAALKSKTEGDEGFVIRSVAAAIVGLQAAGQETRTEVRMSAAQVKDLYSKIGEAQMAQLFQAQHTATNAIPRVSADFLQKPSVPDAGPES